MNELAKFASDYIVHRPVLNETELPGFFDDTLSKSQDDSGANSSAADTNSEFLIFIPHIGLKLQSSQGPGRNLRDRPRRETITKLASHHINRLGITIPANQPAAHEPQSPH